MPPLRNLPAAKPPPAKTERSHEENQERCVFVVSCPAPPTCPLTFPAEHISLHHDGVTEVSKLESSRRGEHRRFTRNERVEDCASRSKMSSTKRCTKRRMIISPGDTDISQ